MTTTTSTATPSLPHSPTTPLTTDDTINEADFLHQVAQAASPPSHVLDLTGQVVTLSNVIRLKRSGSLIIKNGTIRGNASTIFSLGTDRKSGPPALTLQGTTLIHCFQCEENESPYAAIFAQGKARVVLSDVTIISEFGFGLWAKHGSHTVLSNCRFESFGKSAVACYNSARVEMSGCMITDAKVQGICVRGTAQVLMTNCCISNCGENAVVGFQQASICLEECQVSRTICPTKSAIYVEASDTYDSASITLKRCRIFDNVGSAMILRGKVANNLMDDDFGLNEMIGTVTLDLLDENSSQISGTLETPLGIAVPGVNTCSLKSTMSEVEFEKLLQKSTKMSTTLDITGQVIVVTKPILVPKHKHLMILGGTLIGECHSIFLLDVAVNNNSSRGNRSGDDDLPTLTLDSTKLYHKFFTAEKRGIGAAIFVQGIARIKLVDVIIESSFGFGLWMKHEGAAVVERCEFTQAGRSAVACFNNVDVKLIECQINNAEVHGVCVRGTAHVTLSKCQLLNCGTRAAFVYQRGSLNLEGCAISKTRNSLTPAIHAEAAGSKDSCHLSLTKCKVFDNEGPSVVVAGKATYEFLDNEFDDNSPPIFAPDVCETTIPRPWAAAQSEFNAVLMS
jgi:hypothetical protein